MKKQEKNKEDEKEMWSRQKEEFKDISEHKKKQKKM